ncbi:MAG: hypothetical protein ACP5DY_08205 [Thermovirgaceae bacterium]
MCTWHNLHFLQKLMELIREAIFQGEFESLRRGFHENFRDGGNSR